ncbi:MAG: prolipoprotein diacylglyceryl transferase [Dehalococcoidia bacterium]|nr:prolipoprotein diacylglyceryl transferase [Dehalococcoidia bacterium]
MGITIGIDPVAFSIGGADVRWYGLTMALGVAVLIGWTAWQIRRGAKISFDTMLGGALVGIPSGIIFARVLHVIDEWEYYSQSPGQIIGGEGLTVYGAILGAALGVWIYSRFVKVDYLYAADIVTPGIILAQAIGRVGCVINGCCFGELATNLPWGVIYTHPGCYAGGYLNQMVHPTNAYEIVFLLALFGVIIAFRRKFKPDGAKFLFYMGMYGLWRIGIGFLRINDPFFLGLEQAQFIGLVSALICFPLMYYRARRVWVLKPDSTQESEAQPDES